ncbi:unnamed protein product, partial [Rangifer tarandus platyrhynchus]
MPRKVTKCVPSATPCTLLLSPRYHVSTYRASQTSRQQPEAPGPAAPGHVQGVPQMMGKAGGCTRNLTPQPDAHTPSVTRDSASSVQATTCGSISTASPGVTELSLRRLDSVLSGPMSGCLWLGVGLQLSEQAAPTGGISVHAKPHRCVFPERDPACWVSSSLVHDQVVIEISRVSDADNAHRSRVVSKLPQFS